jgi:hypothetical protein
MSGTPNTPDSQTTTETQGSYESLRLPLGQLFVMVIGAAFYSAIVTFAAAGFGVWIFPRTPWWYAAFIAPGLLPFKLLLRHGHFSSLQNRESWLAFAVTFLYYFGLLFAFLFWSNRRWRRKRAPRIDA